MSNFPSVRPSLNLQFDSQPTPADMTSHLASVGATFSRASIGTYTDANGLVAEATAGQARPNYSTDGVHEGLLIEEARTNLVKSSEDFSTTDWLTSNSSVTVNQAIAPDGTASADKLIPNTNNVNHYKSISSTTVSGALCCSVFAKADGYNYIRLRFNGSTAQGRVWYNLSNGTVGTTDANVDGFIEDYGNGWYRCIAVESGNTSTSAGFQIFPQSANNQTTFAGDGESGILIWGAQFEEGSFPTSYIPTIPTFTSRASDGTYFDSSGVLQTASTNVARTDHKYIDGEWVEAGLLLEGASTNEQGYSEDLDNASGYDFTNISVAESSITTPANDSNSYLMTETSGAAHYINTDSTYRPSILSGETWTVSIFAKKGDGANAPDIIQLTHSSGAFGTSQYANFNISTGVITDSAGGTAKIEDVSNGWYRCSFTATSTSSGVAVLVVALVNDNPTATRLPSYTFSSDANVYLWGAQLEQQSQPTSYIATTGSTATRSADVYTTATKERSADVCQIDGTAFTDFYNQEEGTFFVFWEGFTDGGVDRWIGVHDSSKANVFDDRIIFAFSTSAESIRITISDDGVVQTSSVNDTDVAQTTPNKYALAVKLNDVNSYQDGVQVVSDTSVTMPSADKLVFHNGAGVRPFQGYIRKLIYFPRRLSDNELIKLTQ